MSLHSFKWVCVYLFPLLVVLCIEVGDIELGDVEYTTLLRRHGTKVN